MGNHGFTLLELVLVMAVIAIIVGLAVPRLSGFAKGRQIAGSADELVSLAHYARTQSINNGKIYRLYVQSGTPGKFWLAVEQDDGTYGTTGDQSGRNYVTAEGVSLQWLKQPQQQQLQQQRDGQYIEFQPTGRADPATLEIRGADRQVIDIACFSATEEFHVVTATDRAKGLMQ